MNNTYVKEVVLVGKKYLDSMLDERGFGTATEMGGFSLDKVPQVSLTPETVQVSIYTSSEWVGAPSQITLSLLVP